MVAVAVDDMIVRGCRVGVIAVVAYVVEYFVVNFVRLSCKYSCNIFL